MNLGLATFTLAAFLTKALQADEADAYLSKLRGTTSEFGSVQVEGELKNRTGRPLRRLTVRVAFYDTKGAVVGNGRDYITEIGIAETWKWKVIALEDSARKFRLKSIESNGSELNWIQDPKEEAEVKRKAEQEVELRDSQRKQRELAAQKTKDKKAAKLAADAEAKFRGIKFRAESGSADAMRELADCYRRGIGTQVDEALAEMWQKQSETKEKKETTK